MDNTTGKEKEPKQPQDAGPAPNGPTLPGIPPIEDLTKLAAGALAACYAIGLLAVNTYLLPYGVSDFNLFRVRFILTGLLVVGTIVFSVTLPLLIVAMIISRKKIGDTQLSTFTTRLLELNTILVYVIFAFVPPIFFLLFLHLTPLRSLEGYSLNVLVGGILIGVSYVIVRSWKTAGSFWSKCLYILFGAFFIIAPLTYALVFFSTYVFPRVPVQWGGSQGQEVELLIKHDSVAGISQLGVPMEDDLDKTKYVQLLFTGESFYIIADKGHVFVLMSDAIAAIYPRYSP